MQNPENEVFDQFDTQTYEKALSEYYAWIQSLREPGRNPGCPVCGKAEKRFSKISKQKNLCQDCLEKITVRKEFIIEYLFNKAIKQERISSQEIPFLISLSDEEKYTFLYNLFDKQEDIGKKASLDLVQKFISFLQIPTETEYFYEQFYPAYVRNYTTEPGLLPLWCGNIPIGMKEVKKPGEMIHYIDDMRIFNQQTISKKKKSGKLFSLTWGKEKIYSHAKTDDDIEWEFFEKYQGTVVITSERIIPLFSDGTYPFLFIIARISELTINHEGFEIMLEGHERPYKVIGFSKRRGENISFCMEHLVRKGTVINRDGEIFSS